MNKYYVGDVGTEIVVDCDCDISTATNTVLKVKKPDGSMVEWSASLYAINGEMNYLRYVTVSGDFNMTGTYKVQASLVLSGWNGRGETAEFIVHPLFD